MTKFLFIFTTVDMEDEFLFVKYVVFIVWAAYFVREIFEYHRYYIFEVNYYKHRHCYFNYLAFLYINKLNTGIFCS